MSFNVEYMGCVSSQSWGITRISIVLNSLRCDGSAVARHVMDNALRVGTSVSRSECEMISVKTSKGRLGDWSEIMLAIVEVKDMKRLPFHERDWSVGSAPNATNRNYFLILMTCGQPGSGENLMKSCWFSRAFCTRKKQT